jgi:hypothetical protein
MKSIIDMRQTNGAQQTRRDSGTLAMFFVASFLFAAVSVTKIILSLRFPTHATAIGTLMSPLFATAVILLGFTVGAALR